MNVLLDNIINFCISNIGSIVFFGFFGAIFSVIFGLKKEWNIIQQIFGIIGSILIVAFFIWLIMLVAPIIRESFFGWI